MNWLTKKFKTQKDDQPTALALPPTVKKTLSHFNTSNDDFMSNVGEGFKDLMQELARRGYIFKLSIDAPSIEKTIQGRHLLKSSANFSDHDGRNAFNVLIMENTKFNPKNGPSTEGPGLTAFFDRAARQSLWPEVLIGMSYKITNPRNPDTWVNEEDGNTLQNDLIKIAKYLQFRPDPQTLTKFRGFEMKPLLD